MRRFADAHIHVAEMGDCSGYTDIADSEVLFGCSSRESDWGPVGSAEGHIVRFYGIHPWYSESWDASTGDRLRTFLESDPEAGVGEIGLDSKRGDPSLQSAAFLEQIGIASELNRAVNIHMVGCETEILSALRKNRGIRAAVLHSFSSESYVKPFSETGCYFSLNPRILVRSQERIRRLVDSIPEDRLLLETDYPFVHASFKGMVDFAGRLAAASDTDADNLLDKALENARRIVDV